MKYTVRLLSIAFLAAFAVQSSSGQFWQQTSGPSQDYINKIAVNNQGHIFIASHGLHRSIDGGASWKQVYPYLQYFNITNVVTQTSSGNLFIQSNYTNGPTDKNGLYMSTDNGDSWQKLPVNSDRLWGGATTIYSYPI